jgi:hypothetical protein
MVKERDVFLNDRRALEIIIREDRKTRMEGLQVDYY